MSARGAAAARPAPRPDTRPRERTRPRAVPARRRRARIRVRLGLATIPLVAIMFGGVVWLNSQKLALTKKQGEVARHSVVVREQIAAFAVREAQSNSVVIKRAEQLGMIRPASDDLIFVRARPKR